MAPRVVRSAAGRDAVPVAGGALSGGGGGGGGWVPGQSGTVMTATSQVAAGGGGGSSYPGVDPARAATVRKATASETPLIKISYEIPAAPTPTPTPTPDADPPPDPADADPTPTPTPTPTPRRPPTTAGPVCSDVVVEVPFNTAAKMTFACGGAGLTYRLTSSFQGGTWLSGIDWLLYTPYGAASSARTR